MTTYLIPSLSQRDNYNQEEVVMIINIITLFISLSFEGEGEET